MEMSFKENVMHFKKIKYGFEYGAAILTRLMSDEKKGWVIIGVKTEKENLQIYITKTGKMRIHNTKQEEYKINERK